jgi:hypothetical protein
MRTKVLLLLIVVSSILFSCEKEVDSVNGGGGNSGATDLSLQKLVSRSGSDSSTLEFGYNSSKKLTTLNTIDVTGGTTSVTNERVERDAQGIIQKLIIKDDQYQQAGIDSVITMIGYSSGRYISKVTTIDLGIVVFRDSVELIYDAAGKVITEKIFDDLATGNYEENAKIDYTYSSENIATVKQYSYDGSTYSLEFIYSYDEYDNKVSPMNIGFEAFVFDSPAMYSVNNPTKSSIADSGSSQTFTTSYTYNSANKPLTASSTIQPGNSTATATYYYQ